MEKLKFNPEIIRILNDFNIPLEDGLSVLVLHFHNLKCTFIPPILLQKIRITNIISVQGSSVTNLETVWNVPLYLEEVNKVPSDLNEDKFIKNFMSLFKERNKTRGGVLQDVKTRMVSFMLENDTSKEEILAATKRYLSQVTSPEYVRKAHKFIYEGQGKWRTSELASWIQIIREEDPERSYLKPSPEIDFIDPTTTMM